MEDDQPGKKDVHVTIHEYQHEYLQENNYNMSAVIRDALDDRMVEDGADPEQWRKSHGGE